MTAPTIAGALNLRWYYRYALTWNLSGTNRCRKKETKTKLTTVFTGSQIGPGSEKSKPYLFYLSYLL